jgi:hypothetical protein
VKESGIGREGSRHGVEEFVELKYMLRRARSVIGEAS